MYCGTCEDRCSLVHINSDYRAICCNCYAKEEFDADWIFRCDMCKKRREKDKHQTKLTDD